MIKKTIILTASMLLSTGSANLLCDWGYIDVHNETGGKVYVYVRPGGETGNPSEIENGKMKAFKLEAEPDLLQINRGTVMNGGGMASVSSGNAAVKWRCANDSKWYSTRQLIRPNSIYLRKNGEFLSWERDDLLRLGKEHKNQLAS